MSVDSMHLQAHYKASKEFELHPELGIREGSLLITGGTASATRTVGLNLI